MRAWSANQKISVTVHGFLVLIVVAAAVLSALDFWNWLFGSWEWGLVMITLIEGVAAFGFFFRARGVNSPLVPLRHLLPFLSLAALSWELFNWLSPKHGLLTGGIFTTLIAALFGWVFWQCFWTLENLFVDKLAAAKEATLERARAITLDVAQFQVTHTEYGKMVETLRALGVGERPILVTQESYPRPAEVPSLRLAPREESAPALECGEERDEEREVPREESGLSEREQLIVSLKREEGLSYAGIQTRMVELGHRKPTNNEISAALKKARELP